ILCYYAARLRDTLSQHFTRNPFNRVLTGRVNIQHNQGIRILKRCGELIRKITGTSVAMRLKDYMDATETTLAGGGHGGAYLRGMVAVIVNFAYVAGLATQLDAPVHAVDILRCSANRDVCCLH